MIKAIHEITRSGNGLDVQFRVTSWIAFYPQRKKQSCPLVPIAAAPGTDLIVGWTQPLAYSTETFSILTSDAGRSLRSVAEVAIALTTS